MYMIYEYRNDLKIPILWKSPCLSVFSCRYHLRFLSPWNTFGASLPGIIASNLGPATRAGSYSVFIIEFSRYNAWSNFRHIHIISSKQKNKIKKSQTMPKKDQKKVSSKIKVPSVYTLSSTNLITTSSPGFEDFPRMPFVSHRAKARPSWVYYDPLIWISLIWFSNMISSFSFPRCILDISWYHLLWTS